MYITTPFNDVIALDALSGQEIWRYKHELSSDNYCCGPANRGPAVAHGKVMSVTIDSKLIALEQKTGKLLWERNITDPNAGKGEVLAPLLGVEELKEQPKQVRPVTLLIWLHKFTGTWYLSELLVRDMVFILISKKKEKKFYQWVDYPVEATD